MENILNLHCPDWINRASPLKADIRHSISFNGFSHSPLPSLLVLGEEWRWVVSLLGPLTQSVSVLLASPAGCSDQYYGWGFGSTILLQWFELTPSTRSSFHPSTLEMSEIVQLGRETHLLYKYMDSGHTWIQYVFDPSAPAAALCWFFKRKRMPVVMLSELQLPCGSLDVWQKRLNTGS